MAATIRSRSVAASRVRAIPDFWAIHDKKLFLFYSEDAKLEFERDPAVAILQAEANWPHVRETLTP